MAIDHLFEDDEEYFELLHKSKVMSNPWKSYELANRLRKVMCVLIVEDQGGSGRQFCLRVSARTGTFDYLEVVGRPDRGSEVAS